MSSKTASGDKGVAELIKFNTAIDELLNASQTQQTLQLLSFYNPC
nr:hypothetical protein [Borrelia nietonii]